MADFAAADFLDLAKERYGEDVLRGRMQGARGVVEDADKELMRIATSVISRVQTACVSVGWPLPGQWPDGSLDEDENDIGGRAYREIWPPNLLQHALDLFNWRTLAGQELASENQRRVGNDAEKFFKAVEEGAAGVGVGGLTDTSSPAPIAARTRSGASNLPGQSDQENLLDTFHGRGWDHY